MSKPETTAVQAMAPETVALLKEMLVTVLQEARKPADPTPEEAAAKEQDKALRKQTALLALNNQLAKEAEQEACIHQRRYGTTTAVYIQNGNYMICQQCQKKIYPDKETALFNKHFQLSTPAIF